jgi:hypothetical protein
MRQRSMLNPLVRLWPLWRLLDPTVLRPGRALEQARQDFVRATCEGLLMARIAEAMAGLAPDR